MIETTSSGSLSAKIICTKVTAGGFTEISSVFESREADVLFGW